MTGGELKAGAAATGSVENQLKVEATCYVHNSGSGALLWILLTLGLLGGGAGAYCMWRKNQNKGGEDTGAANPSEGGQKESLIA